MNKAIFSSGMPANLMRAPYRPRPADRYDTSIDDWRDSGRELLLEVVFLLEKVIVV
jgi:hypothetical protein